MVFSIAGLSLSAEENVEVVIGDVNGDGDFDVEDLLMVKKYVLKIGELTEDQLDAADVNYDGTVDVEDLLIMKKVILKVGEFPMKPTESTTEPTETTTETTTQEVTNPTTETTIETPTTEPETTVSFPPVGYRLTENKIKENWRGSTPVIEIAISINKFAVLHVFTQEELDSIDGMVFTLNVSPARNANLDVDCIGLFDNAADIRPGYGKGLLVNHEVLGYDTSTQNLITVNAIHVPRQELTGETFTWIFEDENVVFTKVVAFKFSAISYRIYEITDFYGLIKIDK